MIIKVKNVRNLIEPEKEELLCEALGYSFEGKLNGIKEGQQAAIFKVAKDGKEYILKYYKHSVGGYGSGYFNTSGVFDETAYQQDVEKIDEHFKIERAIANDKLLKTHTNIAKVCLADKVVFDDGITKQCEWYSIMEKYKPLSLDGNASPNIRDEKEALRLGVQICEALILLNGRKDLFNEASQTGEKKGIMHGDVKYDNILCEKVGSKYRYLLTDFGISRLKGSKSSFTKGAGGTEYAMAPEIAYKRYSTKVDLYALCATLYLLLNNGNERNAQPRARVAEGTNEGLHIVFSGKMSPPENASTEMKALLVNALEFDGEKRNCKSAIELKAALQKIQFMHAKNAYSQNKIDLYNAYLEDLNECKITDGSLNSEIGEFFVGISKYKEARQYIDNAISVSNPNGFYLDGVMWRYGLGRAKHDKNAKLRFTQAIDNCKGESGLKKTVKKALQELEENDDARKQKIERFEQDFPERGVFKLIFMCTLIVGSMGLCLFSNMYTENSYVYWISIIGTGALGFGLSALCKKVLKKSAYITIAIDIILALISSQFVSICARLLEQSFIWIILGIVIVCVILFFYLLLFEDILVSPIRITNYLVCSILVLLGAIFLVSEYGLINLDVISDSDALSLGKMLLISGISIGFIKMIYYKEINQGVVRKSENRYTIISLFLLVGIITSIYLSIDVLSAYWSLGLLLITYIIGIIWVKKNIAVKREQKYVWLISILLIVLVIVMVQFANLCSNEIIKIISAYTDGSVFFSKDELASREPIIAYIIIVLGVCLGNPSLACIYGMVSVTYFKPIYDNNNKAIKFIDNIFSLVGIACVMLIIGKLTVKGESLTGIDCVILGAALGVYIIYNFIYNFVCYKAIENKNKNKNIDIVVVLGEDNRICAAEVMGHYFERHENEDEVTFFNKRIIPEMRKLEQINFMDYYKKENIRVVKNSEYPKK